ncbi:MAG: hypothetical protein PHQ40_18265 [Anaerolineaceae bacterium]|nr:hypothetical protein [Anaerolineaceae bacterium]
MAIFWLSFRLQEFPVRSAIGFSVSTAQGLGLFGSLFIAVISVHNLLRETHPGFDYFWSRSLPAGFYPWFKFFGSGLTVFTFLIPTALSFLILLLIFFGYRSLLPGLKVWLILICPTFLFILSLSLLLSLLIRRNVIATLVLALIVTGDLVQNFDVTRLMAFAPYDIYASALIGFGPDDSFVFLNRALYLILTLLNYVLSLILSNYCLPVIANKKPSLVAAFRIFMVMSLVAGSWVIAERYLRLSKIANAPANPAGHILQKEGCTLFDSYKINFVLDETGKITSGTALLKLHPVSSEVTIPITLNSGMKMADSQLIVDKSLILRPDNESVNKETEIRIDYRGEMIIPRFAYTTFYQEQEVAALGFETGFYADSRYAFILGNGTWHPFSECPPDSIIITIPRSYPVIYSSADTTTKNTDTSSSIWSSSTPGVLLLAGKYPKNIQDKVWNILLPDRLMPEDTQSLLLGTYQSAIVHLAKHVSETENLPKQIMVVPLLQQTYQQDALTTIFIPERLSFSRELTAPGNDSSLQKSNYGFVSSAALDVLLSWWCEKCACPELANHLLSKHTKNSFRKEGYLVDSLLYYASLQLSAEMNQQINVGEIVSLYRSALDDPLRMVQLPLILPSESIQILSQLNALWDQITPQDFWQLVEECRKQSQSEPLQMDKFARLVKIITGHDFHNLQGTIP